MPDQTHPVSTSRPSVGRWVWPLLLAGTILVASGRSQVAAPAVTHIDKLGHFLVFGLLATLVARSLPSRQWGWAILIVSLYGILDEARQSFTPGRRVEFADWVADTAGALLATVLYARWRWYRELLERKIGRGGDARVDFAGQSRPDGGAP